MAEPTTTPAIVRIPPPIWLLAMLGAAYGSQRVFAFAAVVYVQSTAIAVLLFLGGSVLAFSAMRSFAIAGTEIIPASPTNKVLVMTGSFQFTRNPMYLGLVLAASAFAIYFGTLSFLAVPVLLFLLLNSVFVPFEEAKMSHQFEDQYKEYCSRVRRWL